MDHQHWPIEDAKTRISELVAAAQREPQVVTKHGKPAAVVLSAGEYDRLCELARLKAPSFATVLLAMPRGGVAFERLKGRMREPGF